MAIPTRLLPTTFALYRPIGSGSPIASDIPGRLSDDLRRGQSTGSTGLTWTHTLDCQPDVDVRDGSTRVAGSDGVIYADTAADEVRIPDSSGSSYVVVWVTVLNRGTPAEYKRVYLTRDTAVWPGP